MSDITVKMTCPGAVAWTDPDIDVDKIELRTLTTYAPTTTTYTRTLTTYDFDHITDHVEW